MILLQVYCTKIILEWRNENLVYRIECNAHYFQTAISERCEVVSLHIQNGSLVRYIVIIHIQTDTGGTKRNFLKSDPPASYFTRSH